MALNHDDTGSLGVGIGAITITGDSYLVEEFTPDEPSNTVPILDQDGNATGSFGTSGLKTATATLQKPSTESTTLAKGAETSSYEGETWIVTSVNKPKKLAEQHKYSVTLVKKYN
jgi:hypothetical protein